MLIASLRLSAIAGAVFACTSASTFSENARFAPDVSGKVTVNGRVTSTEGTPLPYAEISIAGFDHVQRTDADGNYVITNVRAGRATLVVSHSGYTTARTETRFSTKRGDSGRNHVDVTLFTPDETEAVIARVTDDSAILEKVGFVTRQSAVPDAYFVTPQDIASIQPRTIADIFKRVPVLLDNPTTSGSHAHGAPACVITYVNGIVRRGTYRSLATFLPVRRVVAAEVYPPRQFPPAPFNGGSSQTECTTIGIWTRA